MENKTLWQTLLGTIQGINNEGSSKRATIFWLVVIVTTSLTAVYCYGYIIAVNSTNPTTIHQQIVKDFKDIRWSDYLMVLTLAGYGTIELITALVKKVTGQNVNDKGTNPEQK